MDNDVYHPSDVAWSSIVGYSQGNLNVDNNSVSEGEIRINAIGEEEVFSEGSWIPKY